MPIVRAVKGARHRDLAEFVSVANVGHVIAVDHDAARVARNVAKDVARIDVLRTDVAMIDAATVDVGSDVAIGVRGEVMTVVRLARVTLASHDSREIVSHAGPLVLARQVSGLQSVGPVDLVAGLSASRERGAGPGLITTVVTRGEAAAAVTARLVNRGARIVTKGPLVVSREGEVRASRLAARRISIPERITYIASVNRIS